MAEPSKKRKPPNENAPPSKRSRFPQRPQHQIPSTSTKAAYPNGEINVKNFLKSHETEIKTLESAMIAAKKGLARRAFQDVPRELRRRTASHNPQRVPKRLRGRAKVEAKEDNTPTARGKSGSGIGKGKKKFSRKEGREKSKRMSEKQAKKKVNTATKVIEGSNDTKRAANPATSIGKPESKSKSKPKFPTLATPATPPSRFRRRQRDKTWLPTHLWHTKRARMTEPKDPLWRFAIPLQPILKSYRLVHRAAGQRGAVAWDMSYMSTIGLDGPEASIVGMLKGLHLATEGNEDPWLNRGRAKKWRNGTRVWEGWIYEREASPLVRIAPVTVIWCAPGSNLKHRKVFVRVHPSAFLQVWNDVVRISKVQKPAVAVEDLRYEIGSIEMTGPASTEALCSLLYPIVADDTAPDSPQSIWRSLAPVTNPGTLPIGALLAFDVSDPRLHDPPTTSNLYHDPNTLVETLAVWPVDGTQIESPLFRRPARSLAARSMPSDKSINRRKSMCTLGVKPEAKPTDPRIPILIYTSRSSNTWTVLIPWKCVQPIWRGIMRYPLSSGGNPRFGGLKERRQIDYERSVPCFPYDFPGTAAGWAWEMQQRRSREHEWTKRPKGKRIEWSTIDLGNGRKGEIGDPWACNFEKFLPTVESDTKEKAPEHGLLPSPQLSSQDIGKLLKDSTRSSTQQIGLFTAKITMLNRGTPTDCARIYRLPTKDLKLRQRWLASMTKHREKSALAKHREPAVDLKADHEHKRNLARNLLTTRPKEGPLKAGDEEYPVVPHEVDLIGFVTSGNYNLAEGLPTAIANLALQMVLESNTDAAEVDAKERQLCIVRKAGSTIGRLARWEPV